MKLLLASGSSYRKQLLARLRLDFEQVSPNIDETPQAGENAKTLALRLSIAKANAITTLHQNSLIIASDQTASLNGRIVGKPGTMEKAMEQLLACSGDTVIFYTGLCLLNTQTQHRQVHCSKYSVTFRRLTKQQVTKYLKLEMPLDCTGSLKCEGLGITLLESLQGDDPTSLIGLPLIRLTSMLTNEGVAILK